MRTLRSRAIRRHHEQRMKDKCKRVYPDDGQPGYLSNNLKFCSKTCCANPRKWRGKKTFQERRDLQTEE